MRFIATHRFAIRAISVFQLKFNVEFTSQVMHFPIKYYFPQRRLEAKTLV